MDRLNNHLVGVMKDVTSDRLKFSMFSFGGHKRTIISFKYNNITDQCFGI